MKVFYKLEGEECNMYIRNMLLFSTNVWKPNNLTLPVSRLEPHKLYSSPDIIRQIKSRRMRWAGHVARMGEERKLYNVLVGNPEGKRPLVRPRRRWEDGIRMDIGEIALGVWIGFDWLRIGTGFGLL
jgi:hypothetical protein